MVAHGRPSGLRVTRLLDEDCNVRSVVLLQQVCVAAYGYTDVNCLMLLPNAQIALAVHFPLVKPLKVGCLGHLSSAFSLADTSTQVRQQCQWCLAGGTAPSLVGSDDDFAALPASSQQPSAAAGTAAAGSSSLAWNKMQEFALHEYVTAVLELQGGQDDNPRLWADVAANPNLWGPNKVTPAELKEVYLRVSGNLGSLLLMLFCMCLLSKTVHVTGSHVTQ